MSTSPETGTRADDHLVTVISQWLARHVSDDELKRALEQIGQGELTTTQAEAADELRRELAEGRDRASLEMVARETLEALALG
jgi:hypothetical protein